MAAPGDHAHAATCTGWQYGRPDLVACPAYEEFGGCARALDMTQVGRRRRRLLLCCSLPAHAAW